MPPDATDRVRRYATREGWQLTILNAGEFADPLYLDNPVDRCFHCKGNLYRSIAGTADATLLSGTNLDDLSDYRPGLRAAEMHGVRHPYVESRIDKRGVRQIARLLELDDLADLPAAPCLSSRIETGIPIEAQTLAAVDATEKLIQRELAPRTVRCRVRRTEIVLELDNGTLESVSATQRDRLVKSITRAFQAIGIERPVSFSAYQMGSAFLRQKANL